MGEVVRLPGRRLGRLPAKRDARVPRFGAVLRRAVTPLTAPAEVDWSRAVASWPMLENDLIGDCTIAAAAHAVQTFGAYRSQRLGVPLERIMTSAEAVANYQLFGYVPGDEATDTGAVIEDVLQRWFTTGLTIGGAVDKISAYASVDPANLERVRLGCWLYGGLTVGLDLPLAAQSRVAVWDAPTADRSQLTAEAVRPGGWGGHCARLVAVEPATSLDNCVTFATWDHLQRATYRWWLAYADECHVVDHDEWTSGAAAVNPAGFPASLLRDEMAALAA